MKKNKKLFPFRNGKPSDIEVFWKGYANVKCHLETFDIVEEIKEAMYKLNTEGYLSDKQYNIIEKEINCVYEQHKRTVFDNTKDINKNILSCYLQNIPIKGC